MNISNLTCCCLICHQEVTVRGFKSHYFLKHSKNGERHVEEFVKKNYTNYTSLLNEYNRAPSVCENCGSLLDYSHRKNKFCSKSCAALYNNNRKTITTKGKTKSHHCSICGDEFTGSIHLPKNSSICLKCRNKQRASIRISPSYPSCVLYINTCQKTGLVFCSSAWKKYHPEVINDKEDYYRACKFKFSISDFPHWFNTDIIKKHGMYSPGNRTERNINGTSRDHLVSISYGWKNNIDTKLLSHPANCDLKLHKDNQSKRHRCEITVEELKERIQDFEKIYPPTSA